MKIHHVVAEAFLGYDRKQYDRKSMASFVVHHKDGDKQNNEVDNLEVVALHDVICKRIDRDERRD